MAFSRIKLSSLGSASTCAFTGGNTLGNFILVCFLTNGAVPTTCVDTEGNTYTLLSTNPTSTNKLAIFLAPVTVGGSGTNTLTVSGGGTGFGTFAIEYSGKLAATYLDPTISKPVTPSGTVLNYSLTPAVSGELMFGCMNASGGGAAWTLTGTSGFSMQRNNSTFIAAFDNLNCNAGNQAPVATISAAGSTLVGLMVGIKPASGVPNSLMLAGCGT